MSILNDYRRYGTDEERAEWEQEVNYEYRKQDYDDERYYDEIREQTYDNV